MPMHNSEIAAVFEEIADLLEIQGENAFRIRAYRNAARVIQSLSQNVTDLVERGEDLSSRPGIGKDLAGKITTVARSGTLPLLDELHEKVPRDLVEVMKIAGLGGKRVKQIHDSLGVKDIDSLEEAARQERIRDLEGFGQRTEQKILEGIGEVRQGQQRQMWVRAEELVGALVSALRRAKKIKHVTVAGSYRRKKETVGDIDILATVGRGSDIMQRFVEHEDVRKIVSQGQTRSTVVLRSGLQVDLRVVPAVSYGAALHYFTGSQAHNIAVRTLGVQKKLKINEYGIFRGDKRVGGRTEQEVFDHVGLPFIAPEMRENRGEIEAAQGGRLPQLITVEQIRGDLHTHTNWTDGRNTAEEMAQAARKKGYEYLAVTDHSQQVRVAGGLDVRRLRKQIEEIDQLNERLRGLRLLKGIELDILENGKLDLPDEVLEELDLAVCSVHSKFDLSEKKQTERIIRAMDNPHFTILGHPTGRLVNQRKPYEVDVEKVFEAARERGCFVEVNGQPERLDLNDTHCKMAKDMGLKLSVGTDSHSTNELELMRHGIGQARRGWLEPADVINTRNLKELRKLLRSRR